MESLNFRSISYTIDQAPDEEFGDDKELDEERQRQS